MNKLRTKKQRIIREDIKDRHTSHWDLDYVSREELEQLMSKNKDDEVLEALKPGDSSHAKNDSAESAEKPMTGEKNPAPDDRDP